MFGPFKVYLSAPSETLKTRLDAAENKISFSISKSCDEFNDPFASRRRLPVRDYLTFYFCRLSEEFKGSNKSSEKIRLFPRVLVDISVKSSICIVQFSSISFAACIRHGTRNCVLRFRPNIPTPTLFSVLNLFSPYT